jgi:pRiA4b ORF-3-like protein
MAIKSTGKCQLCGGAFSRQAMSRHLAGCRPPAGGKAGAAAHLFVEPRYNKAYWLHLALPVESTLKTLDAFLREIWLECCGHLSAFTIHGMTYSVAPESDLDFGREERSMNVRAGKVLAPGESFDYEYDYGSTTELVLKVVGMRERGGKRGVELLARNDQPLIPCCECKTGLAAQICIECDSTPEGGWLCAACVETHACDPGMLLPVVNSPRAGVCGYCG